MKLLPFRLEFTRRAIEDLHRRLDAARWPELPFGTGWSAGTNDETLRDLVHYWRREFDWFTVQERLNRLAHVRGPFEGDELHAVLYARGGAPRLPLLLIHGWPGSFIELLTAAERLSEASERHPGFDVVVPSLPGFGLSEASHAPGMHPGRIAERMHLLMQALGYQHYGVQGGDWGAVIGARLARAHPEAVVGLHLNFPALLVTPQEPEEPSLEERAWAGTMQQWRDVEGAYSRLQSSKPQTLAYGLNDSPLGLLAWILEKFWAWSGRPEERGGLWERFDREAVLANVTLYWLTGTALSAARTYYEARRETPQFQPTTRLNVPTAFARFPDEPWSAPRDVIERSYRLVRWTEMPRGGHFAALEEPDLFVRDVTDFFATLGESFSGSDSGVQRAQWWIDGVVPYTRSTPS